MLACGVVLPAPASGDMNPQIHGFFSQGFVLSDGNDVNGNSSSGGSFDFREIGLNASIRPFGNVLVSAQVASVSQGQVTQENLLLDYLLVDAGLWTGPAGRMGVRLGKLKNPLGIYNDARDAVFTRPGILLPQGVYLDNDGARAFGYFSLPGVGIYNDWYLDRHSLAFELHAHGRADLDDNAEISILRASAPGQFEHDQGLMFRVIDDFRGGRWRFGLTLNRSELRYRVDGDGMSCPQFGGPCPLSEPGNFQLDQVVLSMQHNRERWNVTAELVRRRIQLDNLNPPPFPSSSTDQDSISYYLQVNYLARQRLWLFTRYDERQREMQDRKGYRQAARTGLPRHYFFARDWTVGGRYDLRHDLGLWAELHLVDGVAWVNPRDNPGFNQGQAERNWSVFSLMIAYRF